jgi:hypothetical protein
MTMCPGAYGERRGDYRFGAIGGALRRGPCCISSLQVLELNTSHSAVSRAAASSGASLTVSMRAELAEDSAADWEFFSLQLTLARLCLECPHFRSALLDAVQSTGFVHIAPNGSHFVFSFNAVTTAADSF